MTRTITQIQGEYGLNQDSDDTPFKNLEDSILTNIGKFLDERESGRQEMAQAQGFGRSSFHEQAARKQEKDVISEVGSTFAQARLQDAMADKQMERDITKAGVAFDITKGTMQEQTTQAVKLAEEQQRIHEEQFKSFEEKYADRALGQQMRLFEEERAGTIQDIRLRFEAGEFTTEAEAYSAMQDAITEISNKEKEALEQARAEERISNTTAMQRQKDLITHEYKQKLEVMDEQFQNEMRSAFGENVLNEDGTLNEDFRGHVAERHFYSMQLDRQKLITDMNIEMIRGRVQLQNELMSGVLKDFDSSDMGDWVNLAAILNLDSITRMLTGWQKDVTSDIPETERPFA